MGTYSLDFFFFFDFFFFNTLVSNNKEGDRKAKGKQKILAVDCQDRGGNGVARTAMQRMSQNNSVLQG